MSSRSKMKHQRIARGFRTLARRHGRARKLHFEPVEPRYLLSGQGILQGISFVDANNDNILDVGESRKNNALISLYKDADNNGVFDLAEASVAVATTMTDANGYYLFDQLGPGKYRIVETAPSGYFNQGVQIQSQLN